MIHTRLVLGAMLAASAVAVAPLRGQSPDMRTSPGARQETQDRPGPSPVGGDPVAEADRLYLADEPRRAFDRLAAHLATDSTDYGALWRAARSAVTLGIREEGSRAQNAWLDPAILLAARAVDVDPDGLDGIYWHGVAAGRRAMNAGPGYAVELAQMVHDDAHAILAVDSLHGGAHNMLGKLNYEVMSLSRIKRLLARTFMGGDALDQTSWEQADDHLRRAADVWPGFVLFHFDLARLHEKRGRKEDAIRELGHVLALPPVHPLDSDLQAQARAELEAWGVEVDTVEVDVDRDHGGENHQAEDHGGENGGGR